MYTLLQKSDVVYFEHNPTKEESKVRIILGMLNATP